MLRRGRIIGTFLGENKRAALCKVFTACWTLPAHTGDIELWTDPKQTYTTNDTRYADEVDGWDDLCITFNIGCQIWSNFVLSEGVNISKSINQYIRKNSAS